MRCVITHKMRKSHVPFIMFYRRILTRVKPSLLGPALLFAWPCSLSPIPLFPRSGFTHYLEDRLTRSWVDFRYGAPRWVSNISKSFAKISDPFTDCWRRASCFTKFQPDHVEEDVCDQSPATILSISPGRHHLERAPERERTVGAVRKRSDNPK